MKAVLLINHGGPEMLRYGEAPDPIAGPGEVVVDIHAASVNAADYKVRLGGGRYSLSRFPHILGRDFSGVVSALGAGVTDFTVGDAVFGVTDQGIEGAYAEKIAIKAAIIAKKPDRLSHVEAAALGLTSLTALTAIEDTAHLKAGQTILIQGGAGGVAGFAVQLCKYLGATVITTASASNHPYVRSLGADQVIDYNAQDFTAIGSICDVVFDTVGGDVRAGCYAVLRPAANWYGSRRHRRDFIRAATTSRPYGRTSFAIVLISSECWLFLMPMRFGRPRSFGTGLLTPLRRTG